MAQTDGSIVFNAVLDNKEIQKELNKLERKIENLNKKIYDNKQAKIPLVQQAEILGIKLDQAKAKLFEMQNTSTGTFTTNQIAEQKDTVAALQSAWDKLQSQTEKYDRDIAKAENELKESQIRAGELSQQLASVNIYGTKMSGAINKAQKNMESFAKRLKSIVRSVLVFTVITQTLAKFREWLSKVIKTNNEASTAIARLKGALLTLAQPIINVIIPAFTTFINMITKVVVFLANMISHIFGTTAQVSAETAKSLYEESNALNATGNAAKSASKSLANFDDINKLSGNTTNGSGGSSVSSILPDFSEVSNTNWLNDTLGSAAGNVASALLLGGIALVAIGAATGSLLTLITGLTMIGAGVYVALETDTLPSWTEVLGIENAASFVTAALMLGGIALIALGAATGNILAVIVGLGLIGAGITVGTEEGVFKSWTEALGLDSVIDYIEIATMLAGIALIAMGAALSNIVMVIAGITLLAISVTVGAIGEENLQAWWEKLKLTTVQQWIGVVTLLAGIAMIAIGAALGNIILILSGIALIGVSTTTNASKNNLGNWVTVLGLEQVSSWVTAGLMLGGIALIVFGIVTANAAMVLAGLGLLGAGVSIGITSGTFSSWINAIVDNLKTLVAAIKDNILAPIEDAFSTFYNTVVSIMEGVINAFIGVINGFIRGINKVIGTINAIPGVSIKALSEIETVSIPRLAQGAVIPPNREFMAVLGDQKSGTNIETPLATMVQAFRQALNEDGSGQTINLTVTLDGEVIYQNQKKVSRRHGMDLAGGRT